MQRRIKIGLLIGLMSVGAGIAAYVNVTPILAARLLRNASFERLVSLSKSQKDNPQVFHYLGLRLRGFGEEQPARAAFQRAAELDGDFEDAWMEWAASAGAMGNEQEAFAVLSN